MADASASPLPMAAGRVRASEPQPTSLGVGTGDWLFGWCVSNADHRAWPGASGRPNVGCVRYCQYHVTAHPASQPSPNQPNTAQPNPVRRGVRGSSRL